MKKSCHGWCTVDSDGEDFSSKRVRMAAERVTEQVKVSNNRKSMKTRRKDQNMGRTFVKEIQPGKRKGSKLHGRDCRQSELDNREYICMCVTSMEQEKRELWGYISTRPSISRDNRAVIVFWLKALILPLSALSLCWLHSSPRILNTMFFCTQAVMTLITLWYVLVLSVPIILLSIRAANKQLKQLCGTDKVWK